MLIKIEPCSQKYSNLQKPIWRKKRNFWGNNTPSKSKLEKLKKNMWKGSIHISSLKNSANESPTEKHDDRSGLPPERRRNNKARIQPPVKLSGDLRSSRRRSVENHPRGAAGPAGSGRSFFQILVRREWWGREKGCEISRGGGGEDERAMAVAMALTWGEERERPKRGGKNSHNAVIGGKSCNQSGGGEMKKKEGRAEREREK